MTRSPRRLARHATLLATFGATLGAATACSGLFGRGAASVPRTTVTFVNQSQDMANVYAVTQSGEPMRIGNVAAGRTETLTIPRSVVATVGSTVHFLARPLATRRFVSSGPVTLGPGDRVTVTLPPSANTLSVLPPR